MAKKIRMEAEPPEMLQEMRDDFKMKSLLTVPEAKKMLEIDEAMSKIVQRKDLAPSEKVRLYNQALAQFQENRNKVIQKGATMMPSVSQLLGQQMIETLQKIVKESISEPPARTDDDERMRILNENIPMASTPFSIPRIGELSSVMSEAYHSAKEAYQEDMSVPSDVMSNESSALVDVSKSDLENLEGYLQANGIDFQKDGWIRVSPKSKLVMKPIMIRKKDFDDVVEFMKKGHPKKSPKRAMHNVIHNIYTLLKKDDDMFEYMSNIFPYLKTMREKDQQGSKSSMIGGETPKLRKIRWERIK